MTVDRVVSERTAMGSKIVIPNESIESFRCSLCQNYLSVPPVMIITKDGEQQKCGRCRDVRTKLNVRNKFYENLVKLSSFPCIYPKCAGRIQWGDVEDHERLCPNRTVACPIFLHNCDETVEVSDYKSHCVTKHPNFLYFEKFVYNGIKFGFYYVRILVKHELPFLIYVNAEKDDFWISVLSFYPLMTENWKYDVRLSSGETGGPFLLYEKQEVIPYDEKEHCSRCVLGSCELKYHPYSKMYRIEPEDVKTTIIDAEKAINLLETESFLCTVTLIDDGKLDYNVEKPVNDICLDTNIKLMRRILQCPICMEYMVAPIYTCATGHAICKACKPKVENCPTCKAEISTTRVFALEEISENVEIPCQYTGNGCNFLGNVERICRHEEVCSNAP
ncbi:hypothetical protein NQ318_001860 [Aromia moschata]|uniref:RING-type domain-containing protein n=1 Tax=Aromia moschata TaxID=1265417 RepID=A0AAV8Z3N1_9CUCU|nr:hypothetical protein NQ318_001860 [Aromia moschata]